MGYVIVGPVFGHRDFEDSKEDAGAGKAKIEPIFANRRLVRYSDSRTLFRDDGVSNRRNP